MVAGTRDSHFSFEPFLHLLQRTQLRKHHTTVPIAIPPTATIHIKMTDKTRILLLGATGYMYDTSCSHPLPSKTD